ncbi:MAG: MFS transporter, partial [Nocardioidaceae bacterium]
MLEPYRRILSLPGALTFSLTGLFARLPISMLGLGIVLLVSERTGSYALAGTISAATVVASAVGSPLQGRLTDRFGQYRVLPVTAAVFGAGTAAMLVAIGEGWPLPVPHVFAAVIGVALPQIGSMVRARWGHAIDDRTVLQTAFAFEAVVDEVIFIVGPVLVTFLATLLHPFAGLVCAGLVGVSGSALLGAQRLTEPPVGGEQHHELVR